MGISKYIYAINLLETCYGLATGKLM